MWWILLCHFHSLFFFLLSPHQVGVLLSASKNVHCGGIKKWEMLNTSILVIQRRNVVETLSRWDDVESSCRLRLSTFVDHCTDIFDSKNSNSDHLTSKRGRMNNESNSWNLKYFHFLCLKTYNALRWWRYMRSESFHCSAISMTDGAESMDHSWLEMKEVGETHQKSHGNEQIWIKIREWLSLHFNIKLLLTNILCERMRDGMGIEIFNFSKNK